MPARQLRADPPGLRFTECSEDPALYISMNDLLGAVRGGGGAPPPPPPPGYGDGNAAAEDRPDKMLDDFFVQVAKIKELLASIRRSLEKLQAAHERSKVITRGADMRALRDSMQADINEVNKTAHTIKARLEALDKDNAKALKQQGCGGGSSSERTRTAITAALRKKLRDLMGEFQQLRQRLQDEYREVVERRVYTVTGQRPDSEQVEQLIETGESETIFQKAILEQGRGQVADTLAEIQERHDAVQQLEKSLLDLHQIFLDMAVLVEAQGEMLDNIEAQVARSVEYVQQGTTALVDAKRYQKGTRKLMCACLIICLIIIGIIAGVIAWQVTKK